MKWAKYRECFKACLSTDVGAERVQLVGRGDKALTYLARYRYRGVISESNIVSYQDGKVTFRYKNSSTKQYQTIIEPAVEFLWRVIQHVLPKAFHRTRDYGFLHGNAKRTLQRIQLLLKVRLTPPPTRHQGAFCCPDCGAKLEVIGYTRNRLVPLAERTDTARDCA